MQRMGQHCAVALILLAVITFPAGAYKLSPEGTEEQRRMAGIQGTWISRLELFAVNHGLAHFTDPVHEEITNRMFGCDGGVEECGGSGAVRAPAAVLAGVRWNDDPAFRLSAQQGGRTKCKVVQTIRFQTQPYCWYQLFDDAKSRAAGGEFFDEASGSSLLYRSHFGDLQPIHAMASKEGDLTADTQAAVLSWLEFTWNIAVGVHGLETQVKGVVPAGISSSFKRTEWTVQDLFTVGAPGLRRHVDDVALGSFLHTIQDSFASGHAERGAVYSTVKCSLGDTSIIAPGAIVEFYSYGKQDSDLHAQSDSRGAFATGLQEDGDVVEVGRILVEAVEAKRSWEDVKPFVDCVFRLSPNARPASSGASYSIVATY